MAQHQPWKFLVFKFIILGGCIFLGAQGSSLFDKIHEQSPQKGDKSSKTSKKSSSGQRRASNQASTEEDATKSSTVLDPDFDMIRRIKAGTFDFFRDSLPGMLETVTKREARQIFEQFPFMKTTNVWKRFIETGEAADEDAAAAAMVEAVREMGATLIEARSITKDADTVVQHANDFLDDLKANDASSPELVASAKRGSPRAIATLQQKFVDQYLGGIDLETFQNPEWVDRARDNFFADENLLRAVGDESVLSNLRNPNLRPLKVSEYEEADPSRILSSLTGNQAPS